MIHGKQFSKAAS